jgi:hypothetical protein
MTYYEKHENVSSMVEEMLKHILFVQFGEITLSLKIHDGRIVSTTHSLTKNIIKKETK